MLDLSQIIKQFKIEGVLHDYAPYGCGHINDTYKVTLIDDCQHKHYIIQRINHNVFKNIDQLMHNIVNVCNHIRGKVIKEGGNPEDVLYVIPSIKNENYVTDNHGNYFRCYNFISGGISIETKPTENDLFISGIGYGKFQNYLRDFTPDALYETIPNFHNTTQRLNNLINAVKNNASSRLIKAKTEVDNYLSRSDYAARIIKLLNNGSIPYRVTHNDTKLNNILIDKASSRAVATIDLDTVMPGSIVYDFGDSIRFGANTGAEDEKDLSLVNFSFNHYKAFCDGFLSQVKDILTPFEIANMAFGAILMTYECGMRFLTDYLEGDKYFKVKHDDHNLIRAKTQIKLVQDMEKQIQLMQDYVYSVCNKESN